VDHIIGTKNVEIITFSERKVDFGSFFLYINGMMKRDLYHKLLEWKQSRWRKPLVIRGARQTGKTFILKEFAGKEYDNFVYLNFEDDPELDAVFAPRFNKENLVKYLSAYGGVKVQPGKTLLIFDEVQASGNGLQALKFFKENANQYHICAAGSLLGIKLKGGGKSFPVGQVNLLDLYPLTFMEFLDAAGKPELRQLIETNKDFTPFPEPFHTQLTELLKQYYFTGGMPEAVFVYFDAGHFDEARRVQEEIIQTYLLDFSKHAQPTDVIKISTIWRSIPSQLAKENKKFLFSAVRKSARAREYESAMQWLTDAGLVYKSLNISTPKLPLSSYAETNYFKVFLLDIGLLGAMSGVTPGMIIKGNDIFSHFHGAFVENYVAQQLIGKFKGELFYWTSPGKAEVDFLFSDEGVIFPLEAKAGINLKSKSLKVYSEKYQPAITSRTSLNNLKADGITRNYPLYAVSLFPV
jgi:predicted AAA+ superfamily ATPase